MKYLIDTCVISELIKPMPDANVEKWFYSKKEESLHISVLTFGELKKGISKLTDSKKKNSLIEWLAEIENRFIERTLDVNKEVAESWGLIQGLLEKKGEPMPTIDALIACTAITNSMAVVTRNTKDMARSGVELINPWLLTTPSQG
ncbi:MAG: type II toxin-antitoxin system VapC family toxin [Lentisphaerota bacterium]